MPLHLAKAETSSLPPPPDSGRLIAPEPGSIWRHKGGTLYTVLDVTSAPDDAKKDEFPVTVIYIGPDGRKWPRTLKRWYASMTQVAPAEFKAGTLLSLVNVALITWRAKRAAAKASR